MPHIAVHYLPQFVAETELAGSTVVVVDLVRASTTICQALAAGAQGVVPCLEVDETFATATQYERSQILLGGERGGQPIEGFDLGNSPADYTAQQVFGRTVLFTSTNGTRALHHARLAQRVVIGAAVNRQAVVQQLDSCDEVHILCAGTGGKVTREDILAAGAIASGLTGDTNPWAASACGEWQELLNTARALGRTPSQQLAQELRTTTGGKNLIALGLEEDLEDCAQLDQLTVVPVLDPQKGVLHDSH